MKAAHVPCELWRWRSERRTLADVHRAAGLPWSADLAAIDMRFHEWGYALGGRKRPGERCLAEDWGWTRYAVVAFLAAPGWREEELRKALTERAQREATRQAG